MIELKKNDDLRYIFDEIEFNLIDECLYLVDLRFRLILVIDDI
jgi:hypothetical protein